MQSNKNKEALLIYKKNILFYSPILIIIGVLLIRPGIVLYKDNYSVIKSVELLAVLPIILIILVNKNKADYFLIFTIISGYIFFGLTISLFRYSFYHHNIITFMSALFITLGHILSLVFYYNIVAKVSSKSKISLITELKTEELNNKESLVCVHLFGLDDVPKNYPVILTIEDHYIKFLIINDNNEIDEIIFDEKITDLSYRYSNTLKSSLGLSLVPNKLYVADLFFKNSNLSVNSRYDHKAVPKTNIDFNWEIKITYNKDDKEKIILLNMKKNPKEIIKKIKF